MFSLLMLAFSTTCLWFASTVLAQSASATSSSTSPVSTACGDIFDYVNQDPNGNWLYWASDVYDCLSTVPLLESVALRYIDYYNSTIQYQSTLAYLKNPPNGYQQPAIDVEQVLGEIRRNVTAGYYENQYDFEVTLQMLVQRMHDGHVSLSAGALSAFTFGSPYSIMSVSVDGIQTPKVYIKDDVIAYALNGGSQPSAISAINGIETVQYLTNFALNYSYGFLEPNGDWNNLMYSPVQDILATFDLFGWGALWYPGDELVFNFENGTNQSTFYLAYYTAAEYTGPLTTGGDYYNYWVLGLTPASYDPPLSFGNSTTNVTTSGNVTTSNSTSWYSTSPAYPMYADVVQPELSLQGEGFVTGYFLRDIATGVLSIPTFYENEDALDPFSDTVAKFIDQAKANGMTKIVIDLQGNQGGNVLLAYDTFHQFFPSVDPFAGSRRRDFAQENVLGNAMTNFWNSLFPGDPDYDYDYYYGGLAANEWVVTPRLNAATGRNFSSWQEYYNPITAQGDIFSQTERYNVSSTLFEGSASGGWVPRPRPTTTPWSAENVILLTDATCGSTCSLFLETMNYQAGVRTVVVGGRPSSGPMQAASGGRGARSYDAYTLDANMQFAEYVNETANTTLPQVFDQAIFTYYLGFNLRDQLRRNDTTPLQFKYQAANCRIYYTFANAYNMERLWRDAVTAIYTNSSLCVAGSTGYTTTSNSTATSSPPSPNSTNVPFFGVRSSNVTTDVIPHGAGITDGRVQAQGSFTSCDGGNSCKCTAQQISTVTCPNGKVVHVCGGPCFSTAGCAGDTGICKGLTRQTEQKNILGATQKSSTDIPTQSSRAQGFCVPNQDAIASLPGCKSGSGGQPGIPPPS